MEVKSKNDFCSTDFLTKIYSLFNVYAHSQNSTTEVMLTWDDNKQSFSRLTPSFGISLDTLFGSSFLENNRFLFSGGAAVVLDISVI